MERHKTNCALPDCFMLNATKNTKKKRDRGTRSKTIRFFSVYHSAPETCTYLERNPSPGPEGHLNEEGKKRKGEV